MKKKKKELVTNGTEKASERTFKKTFLVAFLGRTDTTQTT